MKNIEKRREFWGGLMERHTTGFPKFSTRFINDYKDKSLLEIGPGLGNDIPMYKEYCSDVMIADISKRIIESHKTTDGYWIEDYDSDFEVSFDVVVSWYVIHHVIPNEVELFFKFVRRHCHGLFLFNCPTPVNSPGDEKWRADDGIKTSRHLFPDLRKALTNADFAFTEIETIGKNTKMGGTREIGGAVFKCLAV